eukprot:TRINITY_DN32352_c0_g1_i1.p1 TRINITY_DN32352_c0_g1~~TRINITY_DN32352_c0_g1_i1.p1  ORF type:complete len:451 (-),score=72.10 TRINITY_DN32352_c0_g1_i1:52-1404(-)
MTALAALGYNASTIGNHDFDGKSEDSNVTGITHFKRMAAKHAPNVKFLCANVIDARTRELVLPSHAIFEPVQGLRVGVTALLGEQAWEVTSPEVRQGLDLSDPFEAAKAAAEELQSQGCDVLVCLSHTGVDRGDLVLAKLGLFDVIFSGHAHFFEQSGVFEKIDGPGKRLGLLSKGFAMGGAICWARLKVNRQTRRIVDQTTGVRVLDDGCEEHAGVGAMVATWKSQLMKAMRLDEILGHCGKDLELPDKDVLPFCLESSIHSALQSAVLQEASLQMEKAGHVAPCQHSTLVITNRYSAATGLKTGPVTRYDLMRLIRYNGGMQLAELSGRLLAAIVQRNARFVGMADFLYLRGVSYTLSGLRGSPLPEKALSREEIQSGCLECNEAKVFGQSLNLQTGWYPAIIDVYVLDTLLADLPERVGGIRNPVGMQWHLRDLVEGFLQRGSRIGL